jgi:hypothetical protein
MTVIPSTSVRSKYLKRLPIGTVYKDPKSGYNYKVTEKKMNENMIKIAIPCLSAEEQPIILADLPKEFLKQDSAPKANIFKSMKIRLIQLEETNKQLLLDQNKSLYQRISDKLNGLNYYESESSYYFLDSGIVIPIKKQKYSTLEDAQNGMEEIVNQVFSDSTLLSKAMSKQHSIQTKLYKLITELHYEPN